MIFVGTKKGGRAALLATGKKFAWMTAGGGIGFCGKAVEVSLLTRPASGSGP